MDYKSSLIKDRVLFVVYGGGHSAALAPVIRALDNSLLPWCVLALTTARSSLADIGGSVLSMSDVVDGVDGYRRVRRVGKLLAHSHIHHPSVSAEDTEAYLGVGFHSLVKQNGLRTARVIYSNCGRQSFLPLDFFLSWFQSYPPSLVVATSAPRSERAALEAARDLGIPSVCLVDLYASNEIEWCATPGYASRICVLNEIVARRLKNNGVSSDRIAVTGNPAFDRLSAIDTLRLRHEARNSMGIPADVPVVLFISHAEPERHPFKGTLGNPLLAQQIERHLFDGLPRRESVHLILRQHPSEDRPLLFNSPRVFYSDSSQSLDPLLCAADCVVTCGSTVGLEAALLGIPVVQCMDSVTSLDLPLAELGYARAVDRYTRIWAMVDDILKESSPSHIATSIVPASLGRATAKVVEQILQVLNP